MSLHQKLLDAIEREGMNHCGCAGGALVEALRAVVELHAPRVAHAVGLEPVTLCTQCVKFYPCVEVQAIARELGIEAGDHD